MAHDVFISYSSNDKTIADAVCSYLESNGIRCWIAPRDVSPGKKYAQDIMDAINGSKVMVVIFSAYANKSEHVSAEIERAMSKGIIIIPFRIEDVTPTGEMEYYLSGRHWLDALTVPMEQHIKKLVQSVGSLLSGHPYETEIKTPKLPKIKQKPALRKKKARKLLYVIAAILLLIIAGVLLYKPLLNLPIFNPSGDTVKTAADLQQQVTVPADTAPASTAALSPAARDTSPSVNAQDSAGSGNGSAKDNPGTKAANEVKAEITDSILNDGWVKFRVENKGEEGNFNVIAKGLDANGKVLSIEYVSVEKLSKGGTADESVHLSGNPVKQELQVVKDYGNGPKIQEQILQDGWVYIILSNGGEIGDFDLVAKGYDSAGKLVDMEPVRFERIPKYGIAKGSTHLSNNPVKFEVYIMKDYGKGPKIQEKMLLDGWVYVLLANGGKEGSFRVDAKGYDDKGKAVDFQTINFDNVPSNRIVKGSTHLSGNPAKMELSVK